MRFDGLTHADIGAIGACPLSTLALRQNNSVRAFAIRRKHTKWNFLNTVQRRSENCVWRHYESQSRGNFGGRKPFPYVIRVNPVPNQDELRRAHAGRNRARGARIYYVSPLHLGSLETWRGPFQRAREIGFSHICLAPIFAPAANGDTFLIDDFERTNPVLQLAETVDEAVLEIASLAREAGLHLVVDLVVDRVAADGAMARSAPHWFYRGVGSDVIDPREAQLGAEAVPARFEDPQREEELTAWWIDRIIRLARA